jgi:nucleotide-binding universal stress UspA family protein
MNTDFDLLLCTDGSEHSQAGLAYGITLAEALRRPVVLLGASGGRATPDLKDQVDDTARRLQDLGIDFMIRQSSSSLVEAIETQAAAGNYLTVYSTPQRSFLYRLLRQSTFQRLMAETETPLIRLREVRTPIRNILMCSGGMHYTTGLEMLVNRIAKAAGARITLLHVAEPDIDRDDFNADAANFLCSDSPHARYMRAALDRAHAAGLEAKVHLRRGVAVHEILAEIQCGNYDLVGLGSTHSAESRREAELRHTYMPSITAQVALDVDVPVLVVRKPADAGETE